MRIGIILHGPEIIDTGSAERIIGIFKQEHEIIVKLGGTMGRTAVLDAGLEDIIDISQGLTPSETIIALKDSIDLAILLNQGKTPQTGRHFGRIIASKLDHPDPDSDLPPLVHIESPDSGGRIIYYNQRAAEYAGYVKNVLTRYYENYDLPIEYCSSMPLDIRFEGNKIIRRLCGVFCGENIRLEGVVIGYATHDAPEIVCEDGKVIELRGVRIKPHGLEKLENRRIDLFTAKVKTGNIRRTRHRTRIKNIQPGTSGRIAIIDHCAESTFELIKDADLVITVGDDTTAITADILVRFGVPVIGITDGDLDCILEDSAVPTGSVIIQVREGFDDIVGREVFEKIMHFKQQIHMQRRDELLSRILALAEKEMVNIKYY
ncbi:hypothetical protein ANME2D_00523 [Candidatus Methanoperedens nitroreducens]|uniref:DUF2117 domain-containing protein n=1 Tax=Candidatus Methanoperedens nitratireducens TaxID=1392998 RepID=A0A062VE60_9EURY|nr:DUF2117 domain-containing protein [Candidatus Methanoperedens nitroreducens]KCZ73455.1 hypothetical protein ANME2D_00523 [Candidatus Methanoperedens nitroreducens]MDJ1422589.1 DUF2117 domain-containing protein [Candidatus Methanoperedens sp.]